MTRRLDRALGLIALGGMALGLAGCDFHAKSGAQLGPRGTGEQLVVDKYWQSYVAPIPAEPYPLGADSGPRMRDLKNSDGTSRYKNVQVLWDVSEDDFNRIMLSMNTWIGTGAAGCGYCHNVANMASDELYTKVVARRMLQMTRAINNQWYNHVQNVGVTCWTCHRGNAVPVYHWNYPARPPEVNRGMDRLQNTPSTRTSYASLPNQPYATYLGVSSPSIRVQQLKTTYPNHATDAQPIQNAEATYGLMMHMSSALGVQCTYCHNTQAFGNWAISSPKRVTAWWGIRMVRDINNQYIGSLTENFPAYRKGPAGDPYKANCSTCHQGQALPLGGYHMLAQYPALKGPRALLAATGPTPIPALAPAGPGGYPMATPVPFAAVEYSQLASSRGGAPLVPAVQTVNADAAMGTITAQLPAGVTALVADPSETAADCNQRFASELQGKTVEFDTASASIRPESRPLLDQLAATAGRCSRFRVTVAGFTDAVGSARSNLTLSRDRAASVANYLVTRGVNPRQLAAVGYGEGHQKVATGGASQANRRIEITAAPAG